MTRRTHVTTRHLAASRREPGLTVHIASYAPEDVLQIHGTNCFGSARAVLDIARAESLSHGVVAIDSALRAGTSQPDLAATLARMRRWPGVRRARQALDLADAGSESVGESLARLLVIELGEGRPETQFGLTDGRRSAWGDLRLNRHIIEFDGQLKYRAGQGGAAPEEIVWTEKQREDWFRGFHLGFSRLTWSDCWSGRTATLARLEREYAATCRRYGTSIDDLVPFRITKGRAA